jgi:hypothetical protein
VRLYKARKEWLENAIERARKMETVKERPLSDWLARAERFKREWFMRFENVLHQAKVGPMWMKDARVADKVAENLHRLDADAYRLDAYSVMSNHAHAVFHPLLSERELQEIFSAETSEVLNQHPSLSRIMHSL